MPVAVAYRTKLGTMKSSGRKKLLAIFLAAFFSAGLVAGDLPALSRSVMGIDLGRTRDDLWRVVHLICVPTSRFSLPFPCSKVVQEGKDGAGYAILPVATGHILTVPTQHIIGIESPYLLLPGQPNYWQAAWEQKEQLEKDFSRKLDRSDIALALNSAYGRSQDQFHIHTGCVKVEVKAALVSDVSIGERWSRVPMRFLGNDLWVRWVPGADLSSLNVFDKLPMVIRSSPADMLRQTLIVVGGWDSNHEPGFYVLNDQATARHEGFGEIMLDFDCAR